MDFAVWLDDSILALLAQWQVKFSQKMFEGIQVIITDEEAKLSGMVWAS